MGAFWLVLLDDRSVAIVFGRGTYKTRRIKYWYWLYGAVCDVNWLSGISTLELAWKISRHKQRNNSVVTYFFILWYHVEGNPVLLRILFNSQALIEFYACLLRRMEGDRSKWTNIHIYSPNDDDFYRNRFSLFGNRMRAATNLFDFAYFMKKM